MQCLKISVMSLFVSLWFANPFLITIRRCIMRRYMRVYTSSTMLMQVELLTAVGSTELGSDFCCCCYTGISITTYGKASTKFIHETLFGSSFRYMSDSAVVRLLLVVLFMSMFGDSEQYH